MLIQIYNASSFFMSQAASVLSIDISVPRLHRGLQWDSWRDRVFVQALIILRIWRSSDFRSVNYLRGCSESPAVTVLVFISLSDCCCRS
jgi:hypothetical protein